MPKKPSRPAKGPAYNAGRAYATLGTALKDNSPNAGRAYIELGKTLKATFTKMHKQKGR